MDTTIEQLKTLTDKLLYISESEKPWSIDIWDTVNEGEIKDKIAAQTFVQPGKIQQSSAADFFNNIIAHADPADKAMQKIAQRYKQLADYIQAHFDNVLFYKCGKVQVNIFVVCIAQQRSIVLHTISIET